MAQNNEEINKSPLAQSEEKTLSYWKENLIFEKTLEKDAPKGDFIFYEGPPTANGKPGIHHLESRSFKDLFPRYKTMQGYRVMRKAGWDTHGLPVELEVEKQLGVRSKKEIEQYGVARFNEECKKSVWKYVDEWERFTERIGYWVDLKNPYVTYTTPYIESLWNIIAEVGKKDLIYKDYKVVPWCPRCGTALSSHELAQGYADVKDLSVYVLFKSVDSDEYFAAWTTTPWTLPGNCAIAVGEKISYVLTIVDDKKIWIAEDRKKIIFPENVVEKKVLGSELIGKSYEPLYPFLKNLLPEDQKEKAEKAWKVYGADFVSTEDGTGIVHTAVMYGQDDFELGTKIGLPKFHLVDEAGNFIPETGIFSGRFVKDEEVAVDVIKDLAGRGLLLKKEKYEHSYPFCWRCKTPLIYYARDSWYISMSSLREKLVEENQTIHWEPEYTRDGRFGEWLKDVKDWAISRERYWGTPLPIWVSKSGKAHFIGSIEELKAKTKNRGNHFIFVRHGESEHNIRNIVSSDEKDDFHLTQKGKDQVDELAKILSNKDVNAIYSSPFIRTKETAELLAQKLGMSEESIVFDNRIREYNFGEFQGTPFDDFLAHEAEHIHAYDIAIPGGESYLDSKKRFGDFLYDIDSKYSDATIVVVTHGIGLEVAPAIIEGANLARSKEIIDTAEFLPGSFYEFDFIPLPHNDLYEIDLHKPFIDEIVLVDESGEELRRVKEVMDVWFDSGAMPFAQHHYPFENKELVDNRAYPADFICEAIDQTRGWFYTLHAIGTLLGRGKAFKNVICLGHILDKEGQKMSKSRGNTINPWEKIDQYGADVLRFWMYSVNQPGESKNFDERTVDEIVKKVFNLLSNVHSFYEMYSSAPVTNSRPESKNELDKWILSLLAETHYQVTCALDAYQPLEGARVIREFIADLSQWYVRRSRDRFKGDNEEDKDNAIRALGYVLYEISKILAPFTPFFAEDMYLRLTKGTHSKSVHLENWTKAQQLSPDEKNRIERMNEVRDLVSRALEIRAKQGIKIRQPLRSMTLRDEKFKDQSGLVEIMLDELNIKEANFDPNQNDPVAIDVSIDESLQQEGDAREFIRAVQDARKVAGLVPGDVIKVKAKVSQNAQGTILIFEEEIKKTCNIRDIELSVFDTEVSDFVFEIEVARI